MGCFRKDNKVADLLANWDYNVLMQHRVPREVVDEKNNGEMKWVSTKVDVDKRVVVPQVDEQNLHESPDTFVENYIYNLSKTTLDKSKPLGSPPSRRQNIRYD
ncbi:hypothetical protein K7X08_009648 [Anisodus acutangulus]|uniref:Uncharacterized protein n=1 Tax=Anisodus acutangulus TaxID=402998 RepID=A0A9Q1MZQ2_9SOLA|nr:hypothetical protein K7X08_009648 [Anisodus acutangulus]